MEAYILQRGLRRPFVAEGDMIKGNVPRERNILLIDGIGHALRVEHLADAPGRHLGLGEADDGKGAGNHPG